MILLFKESAKIQIIIKAQSLFVTNGVFFALTKTQFRHNGLFHNKLYCFSEAFSLNLQEINPLFPSSHGNGST